MNVKTATSFLAILGLLGSFRLCASLRCWHSSLTRQTPNSNPSPLADTVNEVYNARAPHGGVVAINCTKNCYGEIYQVGEDWFYQVGCTTMDLVQMEEKRGNGMYYMGICNTDWCNKATASLPSILIMMLTIAVPILYYHF